MSFRDAHVAVLGWAGATHRELRPVARWYSGRGARPFISVSRVLRNSWRFEGWPREGRELAVRVRGRLRQDDAPLFIHLFSNAGFWAYAALLEELEEVYQRRIAGVILDSAPGFTPDFTARFFSRSATQAFMPMTLRALGRRPRLDHPWLTPAMRVFFWWWYHVGGTRPLRPAQSLAGARDAGQWPMLFLYSDTDRLVPAEYVERFMGSLGERRVSRSRFEGSSHVLHMVQHRRIYFDTVARFIEG